MDTIYKKIRAVEFERLPESIQNLHFVAPVYSERVWPKKRGFQLLSPSALDYAAEQNLFSKLGIKSWRDSGTLCIIYKGMNIRKAAEILLQMPTKQQMVLSKAWIKYSSPLKMYFFPFANLSEVSEFKFLISPIECHRISCCLRGQSAKNYQEAMPEILDFVKEIASELDEYLHIIDVAYTPSGTIRLLDVNPALTPMELKSILQA